MICGIPAEQVQSVVDACAREVLAEAGISGPSVDAFRLASELGHTVARDFGMEQRARFARIANSSESGQGAILLADEPRAERRHWAVAHEIGESVAYRVFSALGISTLEIPDSVREQTANYLASALLLPRDWFASSGQACDWDLFDLKRHFATASHELIARRMLQMNPSIIITLFDQGAVQWRRSNVLAHPPRLTSTEQSVWRTSFELSEPAIFEPDVLPVEFQAVRCWPVHEPGWRREILRTELQDW